MNWAAEKAEWPLAETSLFVRSGPHKWHVQTQGSRDKPTILLIHGTGASGHSWSGLIPLLATDYHVISFDLPGHGFSKRGGTRRAQLPTIAYDLSILMHDMDLSPALVIGHSAGAAIALELTQHIPVQGIVGLNSALSEFQGVAGWLFPALAKFLALNPLTALVFAKTATPRNVASMIKATGSDLSPKLLRPYFRLVRDRAHVDGVLNMMADWDLSALVQNMPQIDVPVLLLAGSADGTVSPDTSAIAAKRLCRARVQFLPRRGHLMHEEDPVEILALIAPFLRACLREINTQPLAQRA